MAVLAFIDRIAFVNARRLNDIGTDVLMAKCIQRLGLFDIAAYEALVIGTHAFAGAGRRDFLVMDEGMAKRLRALDAAIQAAASAFADRITILGTGRVMDVVMEVVPQRIYEIGVGMLAAARAHHDVIAFGFASGGYAFFQDVVMPLRIDRVRFEFIDATSRTETFHVAWRRASRRNLISMEIMPERIDIVGLVDLIAAAGAIGDRKAHLCAGGFDDFGLEVMA